MTDMVFRTSNIDQPLFDALIDARHTHGGSHEIIEDIQRQPVTYNRLIMGSASSSAAALPLRRRGSRRSVSFFPMPQEPW